MKSVVARRTGAKPNWVGRGLLVEVLRGREQQGMR